MAHALDTMKNTRWRRSAYVGGSGGLTYVKPPNPQKD